MAHFLLISVLFIMSPVALANSCCGQSPASYTVLSLNQRLSVSAGLSYLRSYGRYRPFANGQEGLEVWDDKKREVSSTIFNVASAFAPRQQVFVNASVLQGRYSDVTGVETATHLSDTLIGYSYEALPEYSFSYWKPVIFLTGFLNLPTGRSTYDMNLSEGTDVTGHDQWGAGLGVTLRKVYFPLTITLQARSLQLFAKSFTDVAVSDFFDSSVAFLLNYSSRWWGLQWNTGLTFNHLSERTTQALPGAPVDTSQVTQNFSLLVGVQRSISESWVAGLTYSDQTLVGPAKNSILNRSINLNFNYNYF